MIQRWELLGAPKFTREGAEVKQDLDHWNKLNSDLCDVTSWLGGVLPELQSLQQLAPATGIRDFEVNIERLKVRGLVWLLVFLFPVCCGSLVLCTQRTSESRVGSP